MNLYQYSFLFLICFSIFYRLNNFFVSIYFLVFKGDTSSHRHQLKNKQRKSGGKIEDKNDKIYKFRMRVTKEKGLVWFEVKGKEGKGMNNYHVRIGNEEEEKEYLCTNLFLKIHPD